MQDSYAWLCALQIASPEIRKQITNFTPQFYRIRPAIKKWLLLNQAHAKNIKHGQPFLRAAQNKAGVLVVPGVSSKNCCTFYLRNSMKQRIAYITLVVKDYEEAIKFYADKLDFELVEDTRLSENKRWVLIAPPGSQECSLLLAKAANDIQMASAGNQTGGRVFLFLFTDDLWRDYNKMIGRDINFIRPPKEEHYGLVAVFEDLYGNLWDLIQPNERS